MRKNQNINIESTKIIAQIFDKQNGINLAQRMYDLAVNSPNEKSDSIVTFMFSKMLEQLKQKNFNSDKWKEILLLLTSVDLSHLEYIYLDDFVSLDKVMEMSSHVKEYKAPKQTQLYFDHIPAKATRDNNIPDGKKNISFLEWQISTRQLDVCTSISRMNYRVESKTLESIEGFYYVSKKCSYDLIVIELSIFWKNMNIDKSHANLLIINKKNPVWEITRFEPHGNISQLGEEDISTFQSDLDNAIRYALQDLLIDVEFIYNRPENICPYLGPQSRSEKNQVYGGFCQTWVFYMVDLILRNPNIPLQTIFKDIYNTDPDDLYEIIRDYAEYVREANIPIEFVKMQKARLQMSWFFEEIAIFLRKNHKSMGLNWPESVEFCSDLEELIYTACNVVSANNITIVIQYMLIQFNIGENIKDYLVVFRAYVDHLMYKDSSLLDWTVEDWMIPNFKDKLDTLSSLSECNSSF